MEIFHDVVSNVLSTEATVLKVKVGHVRTDIDEAIFIIGWNEVCRVDA